MLVRSWNLFHGNTVPPGRRAYLREMIDLVTADRPDVVCLQEVPGWALGRLGGWAGMSEFPAGAKRPSLGPIPIPAALGRALTAPSHGRIRSAFAGQGNAVLAAPGLRVLACDSIPLGDRARGQEPRVAERVSLERTIVGNLHCSHAERGEAELAFALRWLEDATPQGAVLVVAGDFNTTPERSPTLREADFSALLPGSIDQVLVRGAPAIARVWPDEERAFGGRLLSDHAPVEAQIEL